MRSALTDAVRHHLLSRAIHAIQPDHLVPVHVSGPDPQRILIVGGEAAAGLESRTDELTLPGHLARSFAILSGRGVDVDVVAAAGLDVETAIEHLEDPARQLSRYGAIVLSIAPAEVLTLYSEQKWSTRLHRLMRAATERTHADCRVVLLLPRVSSWAPYVSPSVIERVGSRATRWARTAERIVAGHPRATTFMLPPRATVAGTPWRTADYNRWGRALAGCLYGMLPVDAGAAREETIPEEALQRAVDSLALGKTDLDGPAGESVSRILHSARDWFGADAAVFTVVDGDDVVVTKGLGIPDGLRTPRQQTPCDVTIRRPAGHVVEHLDDHNEYRALADSTGFRFYTGYRIEAPSGLPVGTLCIYRTEPDGAVTEEDMTVLRDLAWRLSLALIE